MQVVAMDVRALLLLVELVLVSCESGEGYDEDFKSRFEDLGLSMRDLPGLEPDLFHEMVKRQGRGYTDFSDDEAEAIVERHNYHRANTKWSASNMRYMVRIFIYLFFLVFPL